MFIRTLLFFLLLMSATLAHGAGSVVTASKLVNEFNTEAENILRDSSVPDAALTLNKMKAEKERALAELQSIGLVKSPGPARSTRVLRTMDYYNTELVKILNAAAEQAGPPLKQRLDAEIKKFTAYVDTRMLELREITSKESEWKTPKTPVPPVDRSPFETPLPGEPSNIWDR